MSVNYLPLKRRNCDIPTKNRYIIIKKPSKPQPEYGKKTVTRAQTKRYKEDLEKYNDSISCLESGHVNLYNNELTTDSLDVFALDALFDGVPGSFDRRIFYIEPLQSRADSYGRGYYVNEFNVVKELKTADELLNQILKDYDLFALEADIFNKGTIRDEYKKRAIELFAKFNESTESPTYLEDLIHPFASSQYKLETTDFIYPDRAHDFAEELIESGITELYCDLDGHDNSRYIQRLLKLKWTDFAYQMIRSIGDTYALDKIKADKNIKSYLTSMADDENVKKIIKFLDIQTNTIVLTFKEYGEDDYIDSVFTKTFANMNQAREYLIKEYNVPYEVASGDIERELYFDDFIVEVTQKEIVE